MPLLNREPETPYVCGLLIVLILIMAIAVFRYPAFSLRQILGVR